MLAMRTTALLLGSSLGIVVASCGYPALPVLSDSDTGGNDGSSSCPTSFASLLATCSLVFDNDLMLSGMLTYDTKTHMLTGATTPVTHTTVTIAGGEVEVISAHNVQLTGATTLRGIGTRPLAIVASGSIIVAAQSEIDVSRGGAGAQTCRAARWMSGCSRWKR
jgi:hypothetical protein